MSKLLDKLIREHQEEIGRLVDINNASLERGLAAAAKDITADKKPRHIT